MLLARSFHNFGVKVIPFTFFSTGGPDISVI